jgi:hypothetical protein
MGQMRLAKRTLQTPVQEIMFTFTFMSMGRDYVSELQQPTGPLFIPYMMYKHGMILT